MILEKEVVYPEGSLVFDEKGGELALSRVLGNFSVLTVPDKTEDGELISAYACAPKTAAEEFVRARKQFITTTDGKKKNEVIAYQRRQSFKPGEVTAEEANQIGYELAERLLQGEH